MAEYLNPDSADKRGYLSEDFRLFHLKDSSSTGIPFHYHEFHKLLLFLSGNLSYRVEGRQYLLKPGDLLLIPAHAIHQPLVGKEQPYSRTILWISPKILEECGLGEGFSRCKEENAYLLDRDRYDRQRLQQLLNELEQSIGSSEYGASVLTRALFHMVIVEVDRLILSNTPENREQSVRFDPKIDEIMQYINENLTEDLTADMLAARFYLSRSWLMHRFRDVTGCPVHQYVLQKRLILAAQLLKAGESVSEAARKSGFSDYSAFLRAFRKNYNVSPRDFR